MRPWQYFRSAVIALPLLLLLTGLTFSAPLSVSVSPLINFHLDANQSGLNFTAQGSGGQPFGHNNNSYVYQWNVQKGASCPGFIPIYSHQLSTLPYLPNGTTSNCIFSVKVIDNVGNTSFATSPLVTVGPQITANRTLSRSAYVIFQGQNALISMNPPVGGTAPFYYQWFVSPLGGALNATVANSLCSTAQNSLSCHFNTTSATPPGVYEFQLKYWDSATVPVYFYSNTTVVRLGQSNAIATTSAASTTSSASTSSSTSTSSVYTTTVQQSVPATPLIGPVKEISQAAKTLKDWLKTLIGYII
jgi:hypothetical protein